MGATAGEAVCETLACRDWRRRYESVRREEPWKFGVIDASAGADHGRLAKARLPGQAEPGRKVVPVRLHDSGTGLPEAGVGDESRAAIQIVHEIPRQTLGSRRRLEKPGQPIIESQTASDPPGVLKERSNLRLPELHDRQADQHPICRKSQQEIGEGISRSRDGRELPLGVGGQLRREHGLEGQTPQRDPFPFKCHPAGSANPAPNVRL